MRPQAHDIIRTWAFYTIVKSWMHDKKIPWRDIVISGHVLSDKNEKLSKSQGSGSLTPANLLERYSADVIRYWTASGRLGQDVSFSENQLKIGQRLITKIWNAFRFAHPHVQEVDIFAKPEKLGAINEWILHKVAGSFAAYKGYMESHESSLALDQVDQFFWNDFCDNYLELVKNQLFNPDEYEAQDVNATKWTLFHVGLRIAQMYGPYLPYVTESVYQLLYKRSLGIESVHQTKFSQIQKNYAFGPSAEAFYLIVEVVRVVRKLKTEHQLSLKAPIKSLFLYNSDQSVLEYVGRHEQLLKGVCHAQSVVYHQKIMVSLPFEKTENAWNAHVLLTIRK